MTIQDKPNSANQRYVSNQNLNNYNFYTEAGTIKNRIINLMKDDPSITQVSISEKISRRNGKRNGYWIINKMT